MNQFFYFFYVIQFSIGPLHNLPFQIWGDICNRWIRESLWVSVSWGVADSPHQWVREYGSWLSLSVSQLSNFSKQNSLYPWYGELLTSCIGESGSRQLSTSIESGSHWLRASVSQGVSKKNQGCIELWVHISLFQGWKRRILQGNLVDSPTRGVMFFL
jgi:hypothetical protein